MTSSTILELRQLESLDDTPVLADGSIQNGVWSNTLNVPVKIEEGDQISVKSVYCDTSSAASGFIEITNDIPITMSAALYLNNYDKDQQYTYAKALGALPAGLQPLREYGTGQTPNNLGDNNKWVLSQVSPSQGYVWELPFVQVNPLGRKVNSNRYGGTIEFVYTSTAPGAKPYDAYHPLIIPSTKDRDAPKNNPYPLNIRCLGDEKGPFIAVSLTTPLSSAGVASVDWLVGSSSAAAGELVVTPQIFTHRFTIKGGPGVVYSPLEMSQLITDEINNAQSLGSVSINYLNAGNDADPPAPQINTMTNYPVMSPFLTTILKNQQDLDKITAATGVQNDQLFINASGYQDFEYSDITNFNGTLHFKYPIQRMLNERVVSGGGTPQEAITTNAVDAWVGANQIAMVYDEVENKLKWDIQHFPIYSGETTGDGATGNDGKPTARYNEATTLFPYYASSGVALQYSGLVWTQLSPPSFWSDTLGFGDAVTTPNFGKQETNIDNIEAKSYELIMKDGINTTGAFPGLDLGVIHASANYSRPIQAASGLAGGNVDRQTDDVSSIFSNRAWNSSIADEGYFILDIGTNFTQNLIASNLTSHNTQSIINRYYTANSFTSDQGSGSIVYTHVGEPIMLSEFNIAIRNPDRSLVSSHILQEKNSVFIEILKPN